MALLAALLSVGLVAVAASARIVTNEPETTDYDAIEQSDNASFGNSQDVSAYEGSWEAKAHLDAGATGTTYARGVINAGAAPGDDTQYAAAFYFPSGTLEGPDPKQRADLDIMGWNYAGESEYGGIRIGQDHRARLIRGTPGGGPETIGSPFSLQEGCWNWISVRQTISAEPATDPAHATNWVYINGQRVVDSDAPNSFGSGIDNLRYGLVSVATPDQDQALDVYVDNATYEAYSAVTDPGPNACSVSPPANTVPPTIVGVSQLGSTLTAAVGSWTGTKPISYAYQWQRCDAAGGACQNISGARRRTYQLNSGDLGTRLRVVVSATGSEPASATSDASPLVTEPPPRSYDPIEIYGDPVEGETLSVGGGSWAPPPASFAYQWQRCNGQGDSCEDVSGATSQEYGVTAVDVGSTLRAVVTAANSGGSVSATSDATAVVTAPALLNSLRPSISRTSGPDGDTLNADPGDWTATPPISYRYIWQSCDPAGENCVTVPDATDSVYALGTGDVGSTVRVKVIASNVDGSAVTVSLPTSQIAAASPASTAAPAVLGTASAAYTLAADEGGWSGIGPISYDYQWQSCDSAGDNCADVAGATDPIYPLAEGDVGTTVRLAVTATSDSGSATAHSAVTDVVTPAGSGGAQAISPTASPTISGATVAGQTLTVDPGAWSGDGQTTFSFQWQSCDATGQSCDGIAGANDPTYAVSYEDLHETLGVLVTATNDTGTGYAMVVTTQTVSDPSWPHNDEAPTISGDAVEGQQLSANPGTWSGGTEPVDYTYQWQRCTDGLRCTDIDGATNATYGLTSADVAQAIRVAVAATDGEGFSATVVSGETSSVTAVTPHNSSPPTISGTTTSGEDLTVDPGTWDGAGPISFAYQWQSCDVAGNDCADIAGATGPTYTLTTGDVGSTLVALVTATSDMGSSTEASDPTAPVAASDGPVPTSPPTIAGLPRVGGSLSASTGSWSGPGSISYTYQWMTCIADGTRCVTIDGATAASYAPTWDVVAKPLRVAVTADNGSGTTIAVSGPSRLVLPGGSAGDEALVNQSPPTVIGLVKQGELLTADPGTWSGSSEISYAYQWRRCDPDGEHCAPIDGATDPSYVPAAGDVDASLRVAVTAVNGWGSKVATSDPTDVIGRTEPVIVSVPTVSGEAIDGGQLLADPGTWLGGGLSFAYQWQRCDASGENCADIAGATADNYTPVSEDVGMTERVIVKATNDLGAAEATSPPSSLVAPTLPVNEELPAVYGEPSQTGELYASEGLWSGTPEFSYSYQWQRCDASGENCTDITGATDAIYRLEEPDVGATVRVVVTATNAAGSASAASDPTTEVGPPRPPELGGPWGPLIGGDFEEIDVGQVVYSYPGDWTGLDPISFAYQWQRCDSSGENCTDIDGATEWTYTTSGDDLGATVRLQVTATNPSGSASARSDPSPQIATASPQNDWPPFVSGSAQPGGELTADPGWWRGSRPLDFAYRWQRCDSSGENCADIEGAIESTYVATEDDVGNHLEVVVTATNADGSATAASYPQYVSPPPPDNISPPVISGNPRVGQQLSASPGSWSAEPDQYLYYWQRCDPAEASCTNIYGAWSSTYSPTTSDVGSVLRVVVTAYTSGSSTNPTATSAPTATIETMAPSNGTPPSIPGTPVSGQALTADPGTWSGNAPLSYTYRWQKCVGVNNCSNISGATSLTYTPAFGDVGARLRVRVTASNGWGSQTVTSAVSPVVAGAPPSNLTPPEVSGDAVVGDWLSASPGSWSGASSYYAYQWQRCDAGGEQCDDISDATDGAYRLTATDLGATLRVRVTAFSTVAQTSATSEPSVVITEASPPANTSPPSIAGTAQDGEMLAVYLGSWSGSPEIDYDVQWQRCDGNGSNCSDIPGASGSWWFTSTYTPSRADIDSTIRVQVTASNGWGSVTSVSEPTAPVSAPVALANLWPPGISSYFLAYGSPTWASSGSWAGDPDLTDQWQRCDPLTADPETGEMDCVDIPGAAGTTVAYTPQAADVGFRLRLKETATTSEDSQTILSQPTFRTVSERTTDNGGSFDGQTVTGHTITAQSTVMTDAPLPTTTEYVFVRRESDGSTTQLQDGDSPNYTLTDNDVGHLIDILMTVSVWRADHAAVVDSRQVNVTTPAIDPVVAGDSAPSINGEPTEGATLTADPGSWHGGGGDLSYQYRWQRCDSSGSACSDIAGATDPTYIPNAADVGASLRIEVTAERDTESAAAVSEATEPIAAATAPTMTAAPTVSGSTRELATLTADPGTWNGSQPMSYGYRWQRCAEDGTACTDIADGTGHTYVLGQDDIGTRLRVTVNVTNAGGTSEGTSIATDVVEKADAPENSELPSLTLLGTPVSDATAMTDGGQWSNVNEARLEYQWRRCDDTGANCQEIPDANSFAYQLSSDDVGSRIQVEVFARNSSGDSSASSALSPIIEQTTDTAAERLVFLNQARTVLSLSNPDGSDTHQVIDCASLSGSAGQPCALFRPQISPNGQVIAVEVRPDASDDAPSTIWLMNFDGTAPRPLIDGRDPSWSRDGTRVMFTQPGFDLDGTPTTHIYAVRSDGSNVSAPEPVAVGLGEQQSASLSPDEEHLTYAGRDLGGQGAGIYVANADGTNAVRLNLGDTIREAYDPKFSPDGSDIIFSATSQPTNEAFTQVTSGVVRSLWAVHPDGSDLHKVTADRPDQATYDLGEYSPDANLIVATRRRVEVDSYGYGYSLVLGDPQVWVLNRDGSNPRALRSGAVGETDVSFGPRAHILSASTYFPPSLLLPLPEGAAPDGWCANHLRGIGNAHAGRRLFTVIEGRVPHLMSASLGGFTYDCVKLTAHVYYDFRWDLDAIISTDVFTQVGAKRYDGIEGRAKVVVIKPKSRWHCCLEKHRLPYFRVRAPKVGTPGRKRRLRVVREGIVPNDLAGNGFDLLKEALRGPNFRGLTAPVYYTAALGI